jgi:hypothetical protein
MTLELLSCFAAVDRPLACASRCQIRRGSRASRSGVVAETNLEVRSQRLSQLKQLGAIEGHCSTIEVRDAAA